MERHFINFVNKTTEKAVIEINGEIGGFDLKEWKEENTIKTIQKELKHLSELDVDHIEVRICSPGGSVQHALGIHDALRDHPAHITTVITSLCASAATIIALAGDERLMSENALYLIHKCSSGIYGNEHDLEMALEDQKKFNETLYNMYKNVCKKKEKDLEELFNYDNGNGKWIGADEAMEFGFVTSIIPNSTSKADSVSKKAMDAFNLPSLPAYANISVSDDAEENLFQKFINRAREIFPTREEHNIIINQLNHVQMKKFAMFTALALVLSDLKDFEFDEAKGVNLTDEQLGQLEAKFQEFENARAQQENEIAEKDKAIENLTKERDDFKAKYEAAPAQTQTVTGTDNQEVEDVTDNEMYSRLESMI